MNHVLTMMIENLDFPVNQSWRKIMFKIIHRNKLDGAEKYGSCASCGKERDVYKIEFTDNNKTSSSISLCEDCMYCLGNEIYEKYMKEVNY